MSTGGLTQPEWSPCTGLQTDLNPLVGVAHHGDEQVDEDDDGDEEVHQKDELEQRDRPVAHVVAQPLGRGPYLYDVSIFFKFFDHPPLDVRICYLFSP